MWTQETDTTMCRPRAWTYEDQRFRERDRRTGGDRR